MDAVQEMANTPKYTTSAATTGAIGSETSHA